MIDVKFLREHPEAVKAACQHKNAAVSARDVDRLITLDDQRRTLVAEVDDLRQARNKLAAAAGKGKPSAKHIEEGKKLKADTAEAEAKLTGVEDEFWPLLKQVPNIPAADVPVGKTEDDNVVARKVGAPRRFEFEPKNHAQLAEAHGWIDKERAAKVAGARFAYLKGSLVRLHWAMMQFAMDTLMNETVLAEIAAKAGLDVSTKPFVPVLPPLLIRTELYDAMDRLEPRDDRYKLENEDLWLQGSAEHVLGSMHADEVLNEAELPVRYVGYATSFRREAGSYGKDMEGIFRLHQFDKLEMESLGAPESSLQEHQFMVAIQEYLMQQLELPYQVVTKCTADIGKPNARGIDIDVWLPSQQKYRETHTADYMTDYQARRLQTRLRRASGDIELVHTNDATVFSQRPLIAILENYQQADGRVRVPTVLQRYYGGEML
jgi:seryl-tRNA synthetase